MLKPALQLKLGQQLTMTPQLQQAIRLLQLPIMELQIQIREALETNVMLEAEEETPAETIEQSALITAPYEQEQNDREIPAAADTTERVELLDDNDWTESHNTGPAEAVWSGDDRDEEFADTSGDNLHEHLLWQLNLSKLDQRAIKIGTALIDAINDDGYLTDSLEDIATNLQPEWVVQPTEIEQVLTVIQAMDPVGVGARSVSECIQLQLRQLATDTPGLKIALTIASSHLEQMASQQYALLRKQLHTSEDELMQALSLVRACQPRPGAHFNMSESDYIVPDVVVRRTEQGWSVEVNPASTPRLRVNQQYANAIGRGSDHATFRTQLQEARWLIRSLEIRNETLLKVAQCIVQRQTAFLEHGDEHMQPMILKDIAEAVELHESTISRVTTNKYMHTPRGIIEFRYFFSSHVSGSDGSELSSIAIRAKIRKLVAAEDPDKPLSDSRIAEILSTAGVQVARRTVAKYREALNIPASSDRKKVKAC